VHKGDGDTGTAGKFDDDTPPSQIAMLLYDQMKHPGVTVIRPGQKPEE
jgi:hypothetical protein